MKKISYFFLMIVFVFSCGDDEKSIVIPSDIMNKDDFSSLITDVLILEGYNSRVARLDTTGIKMSYLYNDLFDDYNISKAEFDKSYNFYSEHPELMKEIFELSEKKFKLKEDQVTRDRKDSNGKKKKKKKPNLLHQ